MKIRTIIIVVLSLLIAIAWAAAQTDEQKEDKNRRYLYEWTDDRGNVHVTDDFGDVPEKYRDKVRKRVEMAPKPGPGQGREVQEETVPPLSQESEQGSDEASKKAEWQQRLRDWKGRLAEAEKRYADLEQERNELLRRWGTPAYAPPGDRIKAQQIEQEMEQVKKEIDEARNMIDVVIPDEARKAGIPPGWLRE